jgi:hypothetical protein
MRRWIGVIGCLLVGAGCQGNSSRDAMPVYQAVLRQEFQALKKDETVYLFIEGRDPAPELLARLREQWPMLKAGSKVPQGKAKRIDFGALKWIDSHTAELRFGFSDGMDGRNDHYRVTKQGEAWRVEKTGPTVLS